MDEDCWLCVDFGHSTIRVGQCGEDAPKIRATTLPISTDAGYLEYDMETPSDSTAHLRSPFDGLSLSDIDLCCEIYLHAAQLTEFDLDKIPRICWCSLPSIVNPIEKRQLLELFYESLGFEAGAFMRENLACTYASGRTTAQTVLFGAGKTQLSVVYEGYPVSQLDWQIPFGGIDVTRWMYNLVKSKMSVGGGPGAVPSFDKLYYSLDRFKQEHIFVMPDEGDSDGGAGGGDVNIPESCVAGATYCMPDGSNIHFTCDELMKAGKIHLNPVLAEIPGSGADESWEIIPRIKRSRRQAVSMGRYNRFYDTLLLGCVPKMTNFAETVRLGVEDGGEGQERERVRPHDESGDACWIGGSIFGSLSTTQTCVITKEMYYEDPDCNRYPMHA